MKIVVLDDDPTGVQTVHGVSVYTGWDEESIRSGFSDSRQVFFILTNSRSFSREQTEIVHREIAAKIERVSQDLNEDYLLISRSDSTLRGHYPLETDVLRSEIEAHSNKRFDGEILIPFFLEGGRLTINNVHYVRDREKLIPAAETEFARDKTFGYKHSDLRLYIEEKTRGACGADSVTVIDLAALRAGDEEQVYSQLVDVHDYGRVIVNCTSYEELAVFCRGLWRAIDAGRRFLYRSAASFVRSVASIDAKSYLRRNDLISCNSTTGGLIMAGSHTAKTTNQLERLAEITDVEFIEFNSDLVLSDGLAQESRRVAAKCDQLIAAGSTVAVHTTRRLLTLPDDTPELALARSTRISDAFAGVVTLLSVRPAYILAKGGITSSDIGVRALAVKQAEVMGQIAPGVPVWQTGQESKFPGIPYIIFPGNVGQETTLRDIAAQLAKEE